MKPSTDFVIGKERPHFWLDRKLEPAALVPARSEVTFMTMDACCGEVRSVGDFIARRKTDRPSNPLAGPIFVPGAEPGDTLVIDIVSVKLDTEGFQLVGPNRGIILDEVQNWTCHVFRVVGDEIVFPNGISTKVKPVIGTFGNAPRGEATNHPGHYGGNLDAPAACVGARLYVPVQVAGGLFSLGDVHACQGDGEVVGAPEIGAAVTVRIDVMKGSHADWCMVEDTEKWHMLSSAENEAGAARIAVLENARFITRTTRMKFEDALIFLTMCGAISVCRTGKWADHRPVVSSSFGKAALVQALSRYA